MLMSAAVNESLLSLDDVFSQLLLATDSSDAEELVFARWTPSTETAVPEPTTLVILGLGLAGIGARRWRQRKAS